MQHVKVYFEQGRFGGWPANHGMWNWGNEILVGFSRGYYKDLGDRHNIDRDKPEEHLLARSLDGGVTWSIEYPAEKGFLVPRGASLHGTETPGLKIPPLEQCPGGIDFAHADFAMTLRMNDVDSGDSRFSYSYDRGKAWSADYRLPNFGTPGTAARTDYFVDGPETCMVFVTAAKHDRSEGRVFCARTRDGGATWRFVSWIGPEPPSDSFSIMPSSVRLSDNGILTLTRDHEGEEKRWIDAWLSEDDGTSWRYLNRPVESTGVGNPPALIKLADGRLCLSYGVRAEPWRICTKLSEDKGRTWSRELALRGDGSSRDIGYCRAIQRLDGNIVTTYYFSDAKTGPERYIGATIWKPEEVRS
ncbi:MAG: exo-alpha-sialidase [Candidatus Hydrogenedentota bacterium]